MKTLSYLALIGILLDEEASALATKENVLKYGGPTKGINTSTKSKLIAWEI